MSGAFAGRVAIVTGGARGIGFAVAERLLAGGAGLAVWDVDSVRLQAAVQDLGARGHVTGVVVDQADPMAVERAAAQTLANHGAVDILVNNAAVVGPQVPLWEYPVEDWYRVVAVDLHGQFHCCRTLVPHMLYRGYGRIVNMTSLAGKECHANLGAYSVAKAGILALTKCLAKEVAQRGILVNAVAPGTIETESLATVEEQFHRAVLARTPMGRFGRASEVAALVCWLCGDEATFTTGALFDASGGRTGYQ